MFRKHASFGLGDPSKTSSLTSTKLRKHLATITQILKMDTDDLEQLASFMGHTMKTHSEWYRLPSDVYQTAKVSKILLHAQNNSIDKYKGCNLSELEVGDELMETQDGSDSESDEDTLEYDKPSEGIRQLETPILGKKRKIVKRVWSTEEKKITENYFKVHIKKKITPKKHEVEDLMKKQRFV